MEAVHGGFKGLQGQCQHKLQRLLYSGQHLTVLHQRWLHFYHTLHIPLQHTYTRARTGICIKAGLLNQVACSCCAASAVTATWSSRILPVQFFTEESLDFQERISQRNGLGNNTFFPPSLHEEPPNCNMTTAREEAELVLFGVVQEVLDKTGQ